MKKFHFELERVLDWRRQQLDVEQLKLAALAARRAVLGSELTRLAAEQRQTRAGAICAATAQELSAAGNWVRRLDTLQRRTRADITAEDAKIAAQRQEVLKARRNLRLMERLRERRLAEWRSASDKETESLAAEAYLARWDAGPFWSR